MKKNHKNENYLKLRQKAEKLLSDRIKDLNSVPEDVNELIHELQVYQIELELQNEELRNSQIELEELQSKYFNLYNYAPAGYLSLDESGIICDVNFTAAGMLGYSSKFLKKIPFHTFVSYEYKHSLHKLCQDALATHLDQSSEIKLIHNDGYPFHVYLELSSFERSDDTRELRAIIIDIEDIKKAKKDLIKSEKKYRELYNSIREGFILTDLEGRILECNRAFCEMLGYTQEELQNLTYHDLTPLKWHDSDFKIEKKLLKDEYSDVFEKEYIKKDGTIFPINVRVWLVKDKKSKAKAMWGLVRDISARKKVEKKLKESEERFRRTFEDSLIGMFLAESDGTIIKVNHALCRFLGYSKEELIQKNLLDITHSNDISESKNWIEKLFKEEKIRYEMEKRYVTKDEDTVWAFVTSSLVKDHKGNPMHMVAQIQDITEYRNIQNKLKFKSQALSHIQDAVIAIDDHNIVNYWNKAAERIYGINGSKIIGKPLNEAYFCEWVRPEDEKIYEDILNKHGYWKGENIHIKNNGDKLNVESTVSVLKDDSGNKIGLLAVIRDITERKKIEKELIISEERYRSMVNTMQAGIWLTDGLGTTVHVNRNMAKMMGYTTKELIGNNILDFADEKGHERMLKYFKRRKQGISETYEFNFKRKDGSDLWVLIAASPLNSGEGKYIGILRVMTDISGRKNVEGQMKESFIDREKYLNIIMDNVMAMAQHTLAKKNIDITTPKSKYT